MYAIGEIYARVGSGESGKDSTTAFNNKLNPKSGSNLNANESILEKFKGQAQSGRKPKLSGSSTVNGVT